MMKLHRNRKMTVTVLVVTAITLLLIGCGPSNSYESKLNQTATEPIQSDMELTSKIADLAAEHKAVDSSTAVVLENDIFVGIKVSGFSRLQLKQIKEKLHTQIRSLVGDKPYIHITTDKRLFRDLDTVAEKLVKTKGLASPELQNEVLKLHHELGGH